QAGFTLVSDMPVIVEDFGSESRFPNPPLPPTDGEVTSGMSVLIRGEQRPWGVLCTHTVHHRRFSRDDVHFLQAVANVLAEAIVGKGIQDALRRGGDPERGARAARGARSPLAGRGGGAGGGAPPYRPGTARRGGSGPHRAGAQPGEP